MLFIKISLATHPLFWSSLFTRVIFALNASAAFLAKNKPNPTPLWLPILLNGANKSTFSGIPIPSSVTERINFSFVDYRDKEAEVVEEENCGYKGTISDEAAGKLLAYVG